MIMGPVLNGWIGVPGIFWLTGLFALLGMAVVRFQVPDPAVSRVHRDAEPVASQFGRVLFDGQLLRLNFGIFTLHLLLTATFVAVPLALRDAGLASGKHWEVYLPALLFSMAAMVPFIIVAENSTGSNRCSWGDSAAGTDRVRPVDPARQRAENQPADAGVLHWLQPAGSHPPFPDRQDGAARRQGYGDGRLFQ